MARLPELFAYARSHQLKIVKIADLIRYRLENDRFVRRQAIANLPSEFGNFQIYAYRNTLDNSEVVAIVKGDPQQFDRQSILVNIHSECFTGDVLASKRCDCRQELHATLQQIEAEGRGVVVYWRSPGMGLIDRIDACSRQNRLLESVAANEQLSDRLDVSGVVAQILQDLGVQNLHR